MKKGCTFHPFLGTVLTLCQERETKAQVWEVVTMIQVLHVWFRTVILVMDTYNALRQKTLASNQKHVV